MAKKEEDKAFMNSDLEREEHRKELKRNIIVGAVLRSIHKKEGTMPYLIQIIEPYLKKPDRKFFGLPF